ncbi:hypothetical protein UCRPC4_g03144 [Phaeomoniella chlamydospora]|uniref:Duf1711 domain protein n=1 Tax=Phaeomoniella chlamydospora TaxID=158046 RepID=A0A0G2GGT0_PHACM|nr:hypothetical protein UCRPC4_g03144 [Phaeomoniella chlamydospora]
MSTPNSKNDKKAKTSAKKIVILKLAPDVLAKYPSSSKSQETAQSKIKPDPDSMSTSGSGNNGENSANGTPADNVSESPSTPAPSDLANGDSKKKGPSSSKSGVKRSLGEGTPRPRGRPGPKKKPRLDDGTDENVRTSFGGAVPLVTNKLGPRGNQGAINARLRALDRSRKPCRKWEKKPFVLKSFTGVMWEVPSWKAPRQELVNGDANGTSNTGESESKPNESSTGLPSEKSNQGDSSDQVELTGLVTPAASSPPPATPTAAIEA